MNTLLRKGSILMMLIISIFMVSCDEDPVIDVVDGLALADGYYLAVGDEDPIAEKQLVAEKIEGDGFAATDRDGFFGNYVYLVAGSYSLHKVESRAIVSTLGGTLEDADEGTYKVATSEEDGAALVISPSGYYKVAYDETLKEILVMQITKVSLIGAATANGWGSDTELSVKADATDEGFVFEEQEVVLRSGEYKIRINNRWTIDRRIDKTASSFDPANGYVAFSNYGGTADLLVPGGSNLSRTEEGAYTITVTLTNEGGASYDEVRTGDAPEITFDPADYNFGIIGSATAGAWDNDQNMYYKGVVSGAHVWMGVVTFADGVYKFRTNDSWDFNIGGAIDNLVVGGGDIAVPGSGDYFITISTADEGDTWTASISEHGWGIIGAGSPAATWDSDLDMTANGFASGVTTYSITGDFTTGGWKFRANNGWDYNIGGSLTALVPDGGDLFVSEAGNYTLVLSFDGTAYSATVSKN